MKLDFLKNKTILITGGTGSFGRNFAKFLLNNAPIKKLIILSRDEFKQMQLGEEVGRDPRVRFFLGDVRDKERLMRAFHNVNIVVHAAALKQVPTLEYNPFEAIKTNILGSENICEVAVDCGVEKAILISTDKAAEPSNLYGATKLCAEKLFVSSNVYGGNQTKFSVVRYENVMGSRGSIIEKVLKMPGLKTVTITHEEMTRFWINLEQSFELVLFGLQNMEGGEVFIPKVPSMKITDMFDVLVPNAEKQIIGVRPGEKIHETLLTREESRHAVELEKHYVILPEDNELFDINRRFKKIIKAGKKLPKGFTFSSNTNGSWFTKDQFKKVVDRFQKTFFMK